MMRGDLATHMTKQEQIEHDIWNYPLAEGTCHIPTVTYTDKDFSLDYWYDYQKNRGELA